MRLLSLVAILVLVSPSLQYIARVPANREECFFQNAERGEKVWGSFRVTGGGQFDIDLKVRSMPWAMQCDACCDA